ncbi:uncharacterized protein LOC110716530 [Chenopodium quinoa]|uniref:uncharacterized protein LOC110716530 n=1 Tax=Chenopodium quinoa TaxID=63459 RepID=UPI000B778BD5|nr:uncharacterized protein LOC110716530 [Chenopodium quinoa]
METPKFYFVFIKPLESTHPIQKIDDFERPIQKIDDFVYWKYTRDGSFSTKSAYTTLLSQQFSLQSTSTDSSWWKRLWGLSILPKWKLLAWKVLHNALPTAEVLALKGIPIDTTCVFCHVSSESVGHLFRDCPFSSSLWDSMDWGSLPKPDTSFPFSAWFSGIISSFAKAKHWLALDCFFGICWAIWLTRNNVRFRSAVYSPHFVLDLAWEWSTRSGKAREFSSCSTSVPPGFSAPSERLVLRGGPNMLCEVSMLFDGAWDRQNHNAGAGWCFLDPSFSHCIRGGARACMASSALHSELQACLFGLKHARHRGFSSIYLFTDCMSIPRLIQDFRTADISVMWTIQEIRDVISSFSTCHVQKVSRTSVAEAHSLAGAARRRILLHFTF